MARKKLNPQRRKMERAKKAAFAAVAGGQPMVKVQPVEPFDVPDSNATVLYVGNLDRRVTDQMMLNILRTGLQHIKDKVLSASMFPGDMNSPEGYCFVQFQDNNSACQAMTFLNGRDFCGKKVKVNWATNTSNGGIPKVIGTSVSIYCGNLDDDIDEQDLKSAFEVFGEILNIKVVRDPVTNKSKNIGFISFTNKPDAEKAIREMHGAMLKTRPIKTNWATRNQNQKKDELDYDETYKGAATENCTVYVGGIPSNATDDMIRAHFDDYGKMTDLRIFAAKNYAFIRYDTHAAAATAICKTNGSEINGSILKCWWGKDSDTSPGGSGGGGPSNRSNNSNNYSSNNQQHIRPQQPQPQQPGAGGQMQMDQSQYASMTPQQQQQYMQYMYQYNPYYQQQYYQYWMQQYQQQQQGGGGGGQHGGDNQGGGPPGGYPQQGGGGYPNQPQQNYPPQNYQN